MKIFILGQVIFYSLMWMSKTVHILYFEKMGAMVHFGLSYSAMAFVGYFSFVVGYCTDRFGYRKVLMYSCMAYSLGLILRIYTGNVFVAILSGLIAGLGASGVISASRVWMLQFSSLDTTARMIGLRTAAGSLGTALGCVVAGSLPILFINETESFRFLIVLSGVGMLLLTLLFIFQINEQAIEPREKKKIESPLKSFSLLFGEYKRLSLITLVLGATTGFYVSFITPYLPLIMKEKGLSLLSIGLSTGAFALIRFLIDPLVARFMESRKDSSLKIFLLAELSIGLITASLLLPVDKWAFVCLMLIRSASLGFSTISEEVLWLNIFPRHCVGLFFGLSQSGFFLGDFLGGIVNGRLYSTVGLNSCIWVVIGIMILNATIFYQLIGRSRTKRIVLQEATC